MPVPLLLRPSQPHPTNPVQSSPLLTQTSSTVVIHSTITVAVTKVLFPKPCFRPTAPFHHSTNAVLVPGCQPATPALLQPLLSLHPTTHHLPPLTPGPAHQITSTLPVVLVQMLPGRTTLHHHTAPLGSPSSNSSSKRLVPGQLLFHCHFLVPSHRPTFILQCMPTPSVQSIITSTGTSGPVTAPDAAASTALKATTSTSPSHLSECSLLPDDHLFPSDTNSKSFVTTPFLISLDFRLSTPKKILSDVTIHVAYYSSAFFDFPTFRLYSSALCPFLTSSFLCLHFLTSFYADG